ncbi:hypothetical protein RBB50_007451 [Rhinocladiella similis]
MSRPQPVQTASEQNSIWRDLSEDHFRRDVVALSRKCNQVPLNPRLWLPSTGDAHHDKTWTDTPRQLSFDVERRLADDMAYILAAKEGVGSVTAVCVEERQEPKGLVLRIAANEGVCKGFKAALSHICDLLMSCTKNEMTGTQCISDVSEAVLNLCHDRIHERMHFFLTGTPSFRRGNKFTLVKRDSPNDTLTSLQRAATGPAGQDLSRRLSSLKSDFEEFLRKSGSLTPVDEMHELQVVVKKCFSVTTRDGKMSFWNTLSSAGISPRKWFNNNMQIDKLAAYYRIPITLVKDIRKRSSRGLFASITPHYLEPYASKVTTISTEGKRVSCHVHAEVQIITHYLKSPPHIPPRFIGTSKAACFLCHLFIESHDVFKVSATHSRLYDQWTIPDLADYSPEAIAKLREVIKQMDNKCRRLIKKKHGRAFPLTSRHNLRKFPQYSPMSSVMSQPMPRMREAATGRIAVGDTGMSSGIPTPPASVSTTRSSSNKQQRECAVGQALPESVIEQVDAKSDMGEDSRRDVKIHERKVGQITWSPSDSSSTLRPEAIREVRVQADHPQYISIPGVDITLDIEAPSAGMANFQRAPAVGEIEHLFNLVELEEVRAGEEMHFERPEDQDHIRLRIAKGGSDLCSVRLRWC